MGVWVRGPGTLPLSAISHSLSPPPTSFVLRLGVPGLSTSTLVWGVRSSTQDMDSRRRRCGGRSPTRVLCCGRTGTSGETGAGVWALLQAPRNLLLHIDVADVGQGRGGEGVVRGRTVRLTLGPLRGREAPGTPSRPKTVDPAIPNRQRVEPVVSTPGDTYGDPPESQKTPFGHEGRQTRMGWPPVGDPVGRRGDGRRLRGFPARAVQR